MGKPAHVNDGDFEARVLKSATPVLVDFWATWCRPCQMVAPVLEELVDEYAGKLEIVKVDVDQNRETAGRYSIMSIPTMILFKDGQPAAHMVGFKPKEELKRELDAHLSG